jgi:energy-coupling factor transporter ATP-binding protein EcfA2
MINNMTRYFKSALIAKNQDFIDIKNLDSKYEIINKGDLYRGTIDLEILNKLKSDKKGLKEQSIDVIIIPKVIKTKFTHTREIDDKIKSLTGILYIPASIDKDGILSMSEKHPWIPREFLSPMIEPQLSLGNVEDIDDFLSKSTGEREKIESWEDYLNYIKDFYKYVVKSKYDNNILNFNIENIELEENIYIILDETVNASFHVEALYRDILVNNTPKLLYEKFVTPSIEKSIKLIPNDFYLKMKEHKGQMGGEYPLSESQREALNHFSEIKDGELLAISGPPGTGKTTLLQSIVADLYVKSAIKEEKAPVIVASSTNNQAVTNIIDSFGSILPKGIKNLEMRWIEGINSFATYFPSSTKKDESVKKGYQCTSNRCNLFAEDIDSSENIVKSEEKMLFNASKYFSREIKDISECKKILHDEIINIDRIKNKVIQDLQDLRDIIGKVTLNKYIENIHDKILQNQNKIEDLKYKLEINENKIAEYRNRIAEWSNIYLKLPWYIRLLSKFKVFKQKIKMHLHIYIELYEYEPMENFNSIDDIYTYYTRLINHLNKEKIDYNKEAKIIKKRIENSENELNRLKVLQEKIKLSFVELVKYNNESETKINKYINECSILKVNDYLDTSVRYIEFWLAVHYYECRWLFKEDYLTDKQRGTTYANVISSLYHRLAMVTPCMVMTFFMLPGQFKIYNKNEKIDNYLYNFIDLLIVDEAGQVSPEDAAASFALAKKAIVVGDEKQIPPVWGITAALDESLSIKNNVVNQDLSFERLKETGQNCSQSSVMKVAVNSCKYDKYEKGLFLSEHRRCYNEIIEYCNELVYKGRLKPCRGKGSEDKKYPIKQYPHMGYKNIRVSTSEKKGCSRINKTEAEEIAKWIARNYQVIINSYKNSVDIKENEIIAIITPFKAQVEILKKQLVKYLGKVSKNIAVGTVHTFQGAERNVIILSTVYGDNDGCFFINNNESLMNVAVSRAKDVFLVFGSRACLDLQGSSSSAILKKCTNFEIV